MSTLNANAQPIKLTTQQFFVGNTLCRLEKVLESDQQTSLLTSFYTLQQLVNRLQAFPSSEAESEPGPEQISKQWDASFMPTEAAARDAISTSIEPTMRLYRSAEWRWKVMVRRKLYEGKTRVEEAELKDLSSAVIPHKEILRVQDSGVQTPLLQ